MSSTWVRIDGFPATEIAAHTAPTWEMGADGGCLAASFAFALSRRAQHQALRPGAYVQILCGPVPVWTGILTEPDRSTWEVHAVGMGAALRDYLALDSGGASTRNLGDAITQAAVRGWPGSNAASVVGPVAGDPDGNPISVGALLDDYAEQTGQRWGADGRGVLYMRPDPTGVTLITAPGSAVFSPTSEAAPRRLAGRYFDGTSNQTAIVGAGAPEADVDLTDRGTLTLTAAEAILSGQLARSGATGWAGSVTLHQDQLMTQGGQPVNLAANQTGHLIRCHGMADNTVASAPWMELVIGKTTYTADEEVITIEPVNAVPRTLSSVIAAA